MRRIVLAAVVAAATAVAACSDSAPDPFTKSNLKLVTLTSGGHPDPDGYQILITAHSPVHLGPNDSTVLDSIQFGDRIFMIDSIASGCSMDSTTQHRYVPVGNSRIEFDISCP